MSTQTQQFIVRHEPLDENEDGMVEKDFPSAGEFWTTVDIIKGKGLDYEIETPDGYEIPSTKDIAESDEESESVEAEIIDETEPEPKTDGNGEVQDAELVQEQPDKPQRNLSDDPIQWIQDAGNFTYQKNGKTAINKKGLRVLQHWYDIDNPDSTVVVGPEDTDHTYCRVRAEAKMPDGRTAVAHGSAHVDRGDDSYLLVEMADTRAKSRVLLDITGMGAVAVSELQNEL